MLLSQSSSDLSRDFSGLARVNLDQLKISSSQNLKKKCFFKLIRIYFRYYFIKYHSFFTLLFK
jgi:hypothetical protein